MDDRQTQIREGAGLEESRINQDFVDFLQKWSSPVLFVLAGLALAYWGWQHLEQRREAHVNEAFVAYEEVAGTRNPSPDALLRIADEYNGVVGVAALARTRAADTYLDAARTGMQPGADVDQDGAPVNAEDVLDDDRRTRFLDEAGSLYQTVFNDTSSKKGSEVLALNAANGLAAVALSKGDGEKARSWFNRAAEIADKADFAAHAAIARERAGEVEELLVEPKVYDQSELPQATVNDAADMVTRVIDDSADEGETLPTPDADAAPGATTEPESQPAADTQPESQPEPEADTADDAPADSDPAASDDE